MSEEQEKLSASEQTCRVLQEQVLSVLQEREEEGRQFVGSMAELQGALQQAMERNELLSKEKEEGRLSTGIGLAARITLSELTQQVEVRDRTIELLREQQRLAAHSHTCALTLRPSLVRRWVPKVSGAPNADGTFSFLSSMHQPLSLTSCLQVRMPLPARAIH